MKNIAIQKLVFSKFQNGETPTKIFQDLPGAVSLRTIERWVRSIKLTGKINLRKPVGRPRSVRTKTTIRKVKQLVKKRKNVSVRKLANKLKTSKTTIHRLLKTDLKYKAYKIRKQPALTNKHKLNRKQFANWVKNNFNKDQTRKILFSDEKYFSVDGVYNAQNDRIWAVNRLEADKNGGVKNKSKFPSKVMVWLGACSKGLTSLVILDEGSLDHDKYIKTSTSCSKKMWK